MFPSPIGVLISLMRRLEVYMAFVALFPSPIGVLISLIENKLKF